MKQSKLSVPMGFTFVISLLLAGNALADSKLPRALPAFKGKTKLAVDFEKPPASHQNLPDSSKANEESIPEEIDPLELAPQRRKVLLESKAIQDQTPLVESVSASTRDSELVKAAEAESPPITSAPSRIQKSMSDESKWRFLYRAGYLHARYSKIAPELQDGATQISAGIARGYTNLEMRGLIDLGHGMDQAVTLQNTRYLAIRGEAVWIFNPGSNARPFAGGGIVIGNYNLRSYRSITSDLITIREHHKSTSMGLATSAGFRFTLGKKAAVDFITEYLALAGSKDATSLGGGGISLSFNYLW